jgi:hypothetical protein
VDETAAVNNQLVASVGTCSVMGIGEHDGASPKPSE